MPGVLNAWPADSVAMSIETSGMRCQLQQLNASRTASSFLQAFLEGERLEDSESWSCKRCKKMVQAHKKLDLWYLPEILVIHLKRFSYSHRFRDKIDALVRFPLEGLDLSKTILRQQVYQEQRLMAWPQGFAT